MPQNLETRVSKIEAMLDQFATRQADINETERRILVCVRQLARMSQGYYVDDRGHRILTRDPDRVRAFKLGLEQEIHRLSIDLMGTDQP